VSIDSTASAPIRYSPHYEPTRVLRFLHAQCFECVEMKHGAAPQSPVSSVSQIGLRGMGRPTWQQSALEDHSHYLALQRTLLFRVVPIAEAVVYRSVIDVVGVGGDW
jgi:hypothetical protein